MELLKPKGVSLGIALQDEFVPSAAPAGAGERALVVSRVREAGIADRCGALHVGDHLISINKEGVEGKAVTDVQRILKHSDLNLELEIIPGHNFPPRAECE